MMKKLLTTTCLAIGTVCAAQAAKMDYTYYIAARGGMNFLEKSTLTSGGVSTDQGFKNGEFAAVAIGLRNAAFSYGGGFRLEVEGGWSRNNFKEIGGNLQGYRLFSNLYYDHPLSESVYLFIGGGVGGVQYHARPQGGGLGGSDKDLVFAYQGMAGIGYRLADFVSLELGYRIASSQDPKFNFSGTDVSAKAPLMQVVEAGIRFEF